MVQKLIYRDYDDFFVVYSPESKNYLLIEDIFSEFFRIKYVEQMSDTEIVQSIADEYLVDKNTVHLDLLKFNNDMNEALKADTSPSKDVSHNPAVMQHHIFNRMSDLMIPFSAAIEITDTCNLNCVHCYRGVPSPSYWTAASFRSALDELKALGTMNIIITGGEPFIHPLAADFLEMTAQLGFVVSVQSNLVLLDDAVIEALRKNTVSDVSISLYSVDEKEHDAITRTSGSMHKTMANIKRLVENNIPVSINCPVMSVNQNAMAGICRYAKDLGVDVKFALKIIPSQNKDKNIEKLNVFSKNFILAAMYNPEIRLYMNELENIRISGPKTRYCQTGFRSITFDAQGNMLICNAYRKQCGSLRTSTVKDLWRDSELLNLWREKTSLIMEKCRMCPAYAYCEPCPAHSYTQSGDEDSIDELTCLFGKAFYAADIEYLDRGGEAG